MARQRRPSAPDDPSAVPAVTASAAPSTASGPSGLWAGAARTDITDAGAGPANDRLYARALVLRNADTAVVIATVDAVAVAEIGSIGSDFVAGVRSQLQRRLGIAATNVLISATHCHGVVCADVLERTVQAVTAAWAGMEPARVGVGAGREDRIMENRRLLLKSGATADVRHAYSLPPDEEVVGVGPVDPEIGILRVERLDGRALAVLFSFACHPIQGAPGGGNTADLSGIACRVVEDATSSGAVALFLQGCAGDVNPVFYKDVDHPRDAETLGSRLGLSTVQALGRVVVRDGATLKVRSRTLELPRADLAPRIASLQAAQERLLGSLRGTSLNLKTFVSLLVKYRLSPDFPSYYSHRYLHDARGGREDLRLLDAHNRRGMDEYRRNVHVMEELTRVRTSLDLLTMHQARNAAAGRPAIDAEVMGLRIGDLVLVAFPGELSVQIGLNIKARSPHRYTFVAGCANGYLYYAPTAEQLANPGAAQEDCDCLLAPQWQALFEEAVAELLGEL